MRVSVFALFAVMALASFSVVSPARANSAQVFPDGWSLSQVQVNATVGASCRYTARLPVFLAVIPEIEGVPSFTPNEGRERVRKLVNRRIREGVLRSVDDMINSTDEVNVCSSEGTNERTSEASFEVAHADADLVSFRFKSYGYWGGAHGGQGITGLAIDLRTGRVYSLPEIFAPTALGSIVASIRVELERLGKYYPDWFATWAAETTSLEKLPGFTFDARGVWIHIPEYAVASYADGPTDVLVPWAQLRVHLRPGTPFHRFQF